MLKGGLLGARIITPVEIEALAELPSRDVLLAQVAGVFQAPLIKAAGLFQAFTRNFAYGVKALIDQRRRRGARKPRPKSAEHAEAEAERRGRKAEATRRAPKPSAAAASEAESRAEAPERRGSSGAEETDRTRITSPSNRRNSDMATMTTEDCSTSSRT